jgi:hypothetical protein
VKIRLLARVQAIRDHEGPGVRDVGAVARAPEQSEGVGVDHGNDERAVGGGIAAHVRDVDDGPRRQTMIRGRNHDRGGVRGVGDR